MTREKAVSMVEAKLECLNRRTTGSDLMCNARDCDNCGVNYAQGNIGEQKEWLRMAIEALQQEPKTGHWIVEVWSNKVHYSCSTCKCVVDYEPCYHYCPYCGAELRGESEDKE